MIESMIRKFIASKDKGGMIDCFKLMARHDIITSMQLEKVLYFIDLLGRINIMAESDSPDCYRRMGMFLQVLDEARFYDEALSEK